MSDHSSRVRDLTPAEVARGMTEGRMVLVDVREPKETALERFPGAVLLPLSAFDPAAIPAPPPAFMPTAVAESARADRTAASP
jgi:rhodanese-related sulfurtransferase